jgi:hypothetical protein
MIRPSRRERTPLVTIAEDPRRQARPLRDVARSLRSQARHIRADARTLVAAAAAAEDQAAAVIDQLAAWQPQRTEQLRGLSASARACVVRSRQDQ